MADLSLTILAETESDALPIDRLHERTFGPGRFARTAFRIRERPLHQRKPDPAAAKRRLDRDRTQKKRRRLADQDRRQTH